MKLMPDAEIELPYEGAKEMILVDDVDNREFLCELIESMWEELPEKKKCYIYMRVSTAAQTEGYSLEAQQEQLREYADYNLEIAGEYCDAGKSGKSIVGRPAFLKMLDGISSEKDNVSFVFGLILQARCRWRMWDRRNYGSRN